MQFINVDSFRYTMYNVQCVTNVGYINNKFTKQDHTAIKKKPIKYRIKILCLIISLFIIKKIEIRKYAKSTTDNVECSL